jgi:hypothetical protein
MAITSGGIEAAERKFDGCELRFGHEAGSRRGQAYDRSLQRMLRASRFAVVCCNFVGVVISGLQSAG